MNFPNARTIRRKAKGEGYIDAYVKEELGRIKDDILTSAELGLHKAVTELRTDFDIPTMDPVKSQLHIYYFIVKALQKEDYIVQLDMKGNNFNDQKTWIIVRWLTPADEDAERYMHKFIQSVKMPKQHKDAAQHRRRRRK